MSEEPTYEFREGVLHIGMKQGAMLLSSSPAFLAEERDWRGVWHEVWPEFCVIPQASATARVTTDGTKTKRDAFEAFAQTVPAGLREVVSPFKSHQWMLQQMISRSPADMELVRVNPVLAYALANSSEFRGTACSAAAQQALYHGRDRQKDICKWLGFPGTPAMVRLFKRISREGISPSLLRRLRIAIKADPKEVMKLLAHRDCVTVRMIELIVEPKIKPLLSHQLLDEIAAEGEMAHSSLADELFHAMSLMEGMSSERRTRRLDSVVQAERLIENIDRDYRAHQLVMEERERGRREQAAEAEVARRRALRANSAKSKRPSPWKCDWPPPPIPGTEHIEPITSYLMLQQESVLQNNCVKSYWKSIASENGLTYAYRMTYPERATFTIVKRAGGTWTLSELKGTKNKKVTRRTRYIVEQWLYSYSVSAAFSA